MTPPLIQAGGIRFTRDLYAENSIGFRVGGVEDRPRARLVGESLEVGILHHRGSLYATGLLNTLPDPGAANFQHFPEANTAWRWWEPPPGWGKRGAIPRTPRVAIVLTDLDLAADLDTAFSSWVSKRGVAVCVGWNSAAGISPFCAGIPARGIVNDQISQSDGMQRVQPAVQFVQPSLISGGELLILDVANSAFTYGRLGPGESLNPLVSVNFAGTGQPSFSFPGMASFSASVTGGTLTMFANTARASSDIALASACSRRLKGYRYMAIHGDSDELSAEGYPSAFIDSDSVFSSLSQGSPLHLRKRFAAGSTSDAAQKVLDSIDEFFR